MMAMGGMLGFAIAMMIILGIPINYVIIGISVAAGLTASSRLYMKAHKAHELVFGFMVGLVAQLSMATYMVEAF